MLPKTSVHIKGIDIFLDWRWWIIKKNSVLYGKIAALVLRKTFIAKLSIIKSFWKPKWGIAVIRLDIFMI